MRNLKMPKLPKETVLYDYDEVFVSGYTADQMVAYGLQVVKSTMEVLALKGLSYNADHAVPVVLDCIVAISVRFGLAEEKR